MSPAPDIGVHANWRHVQGDDTDPAVMGQVGGMCDILFIDTSHAYEHTLWELRNWGQKVRFRWADCLPRHRTPTAVDPPCPPTDPDFPVRSAIEVFCAETGNRWTNYPRLLGSRHHRSEVTVTITNGYTDLASVLAEVGITTPTQTPDRSGDQLGVPTDRRLHGPQVLAGLHRADPRVLRRRLPRAGLGVPTRCWTSPPLRG
jgi:hypothetical protein